MKIKIKDLKMKIHLAICKIAAGGAVVFDQPTLGLIKFEDSISDLSDDMEMDLSEILIKLAQDVSSADDNDGHHEECSGEKGCDCLQTSKYRSHK